MKILPSRYYNLVQLGKRKSKISVIREKLSQRGFQNVFNPSIAVSGSELVVAFRTYAARVGSNENSYVSGPSFVAIFNKQMDIVQLTTLNDAFSRSTSEVRDPKVFHYLGTVWLTFNTGHTEVPNRIFVAEIWPHVGKCYECRLIGRSPIEKNWGFFESSGQLYCLYSLKPMQIMRCNFDSSGGYLDVIPSDNFQSYSNNRSNNLTLGTQPLMLSSTDFLIVSHRKYWLGRKRIYLPRLHKFKLTDDDGCLEVGWSSLLVHSISSMFGSRIKLNKNLISCTYISGLECIDGEITLSYGINDLDFGIAALEKSILQPYG